MKIKKKEEATEEEKVKHKDEIFKLQETFEEDRKMMIAEIERLQKAYDVEKHKSAALELEIAEFRNEILKVKKEKKEVNLALKATKEKFEAMENHSASLVDDKKALHKKLDAETRNVDSKKSEISNIMKESEDIVNQLEKVKAELVELKSKELEESEPEMNCDECDLQVKSFEELKIHIQVYHSHSKASQCETSSFFEPFKCFYCEGTINSEDKLDDHQIECAKEFDFLLKPQLLYSELNTFNCECCGAECIDDNDLRRHLGMYHPAPGNRM